jgi:hypothetical protein
MARLAQVILWRELASITASPEWVPVNRELLRLASGCWPALPGGIGYPQGPDERFPWRNRYITSPFPRLRLAQ